MLSYRHAFHAGNFADLLKHMVLVRLVLAMSRKEKPFVVIDTHAGAGLYALDSALAKKTVEYRDGVGKLWQAVQSGEPVAEPAEAFVDLLRDLNPDGRLVNYPGSPEICRRLLRRGDRLLLSELHPTDHERLSHHFKGVRQVACAREDGLERLPKKLPPVQRRGLTLVDPSYERDEEYNQVVEAISQAHRRFATGVYALWYPVVDRLRIDRLLKDFEATGIRRQLLIEHCVEPDSPGYGMTGSGMLVINPPWQLDQQMQELLPWLDRLLTGGQGYCRVDWLVGE